MPLPVAAMPLARPISPRFQHHENPNARHAIASQPCGRPAISQHAPDFPGRQYQGEQDRDSEPAAFSASATGFHPARALLHGSFHIGRSIVSPRFRRKQTPRNLSTVIPGAGTAFAAKPRHYDPHRFLAEVKKAKAARPSRRTKKPASEHRRHVSAPLLLLSEGELRGSAPVVVSISSNWVPATIATSTRIKGGRVLPEHVGRGIDRHGSRPRAYYCPGHSRATAGHPRRDPPCTSSRA